MTSCSWAGLACRSFFRAGSARLMMKKSSTPRKAAVSVTARVSQRREGYQPAALGVRVAAGLGKEPTGGLLDTVVFAMTSSVSGRRDLPQVGWGAVPPGYTGATGEPYVASGAPGGGQERPVLRHHLRGR